MKNTNYNIISDLQSYKGCKKIMFAFLQKTKKGPNNCRGEENIFWF